MSTNILTPPPKARPYSQQAPPESKAPLTVLSQKRNTALSSNAQPSAALDTLITTVRDSWNLPLQQPRNTLQQVSTAIVYCEANFGAIDGKTANGLVRHSEKYKILSVIDSEKAGLDSGMLLDKEPNSIPICRDLADSLAQAGTVPDYFIFGMAPSSGMLSAPERNLVLQAISYGMNIVNGLHEFLNDDPEFAAASIANNVEILDVRKPRDKKDLRMFSGRITEVTCPVIAVLGTDCAIGKRTTATILTRALCDRGMNAVMIGTGQTGLIQGARYGIALDAVPSQFCAGELEAIIIEAFEAERPDVIIIEGQGALSHPAFSTTSFILRGSCPDAVILQHAPKRNYRCDFEQMEMPEPSTEINLIQTFADTKVIGLTINHENMTDSEINSAIEYYKTELEIPATDAVSHPTEHLVQMVFSTFPGLSEKQTACAL
ncbi:MAG: DUF1611 domain-containing protein [Motiliproteus sp.]|nr:DUF1611 domain-containing protein [Motiliproteus sp.]MCW9053856.1 DUF1611 domain-containing protein [Motiliproteus sp.]